MARETSRKQKNNIFTKIGGFLEKTFLQKKLNNWFGILFVAGISAFFAYLLSRYFIVGMGVFGVIFGLFIVIICMSNAEVGLYITAGYAFVAFFFSRLFFNGELPVGVFFDLLVLATFLGLFTRSDEMKVNFVAFSKNPLVIFIFFTLFYNAIQFINPNSKSLDTNILALRKFIGYILTMFIAYMVFDSYAKIRKYFYYIFWLATIIGFYGCIQQIHGYFNFEMELILADPHGLGLIFVNGEFRKFSTLSDPSSFGILMAVCSVFFIILAMHERRKQRKYTLLAGCVVMILAMNFSGTRTAYAAFVAGFAFYVLLYFNNKTTRIFGITTGLFLLVIIYGPFYGNTAIQRFRSTFVGSKDESYKVRILSRAFIQPYIRSHPIGGGLGTTGFSQKSHPGHYLNGFQPDSSYVMRGAESGWIGLGIVCILYGMTLVIAIKGFFKARREKIKLVFAASVTCLFCFYIAEFAQVAIGGITDVMVYYPILAMILKLKFYDTPQKPAAIQAV